MLLFENYFFQADLYLNVANLAVPVRNSVYTMGSIIEYRPGWLGLRQGVFTSLVSGGR